MLLEELINFIKEKQKCISKDLIKYIECLDSYEAFYFFSLYKKYWQKEEELRIGENFIPSANLKEIERKKDLGVIDYALVQKDPGLAEIASEVDLICNPMDGGLGSSLKRLDYLKRIWPEIGRAGKPRLGAKGADLFFCLNKKRISITELKYLQAIRESNFYNKIVIEELVNKESFDSVNQFLNQKVFSGARADNSLEKSKLSYRQLIAQEDKICLANEMIIQSSLPTLDKKTNLLTLERTAPGGHGQLGFMVLQKADQVKLPSSRKLVRAIYNGDGINNFPDRFTVGFMVKNNIPIIILSSTKTPIDKKGGQIGLELTEYGKKVQILELAQAKNQNQQNLFAKIGLEKSDKTKYGEVNKQYFNTNIALINYSVLAPFLKDLQDLIGEDRFFQIISPSLIKNEKTQNNKTYIQLEGALASTLFNLTGFVQTEQNQQVKELIKKHNITNFLVIVNVDQESRKKFFTPVKFAWDFWFYAYSDHFRINTQTFKLENLRPGNLPNFKLSYFYHDLENCVQAFGKASTIDLESLTIEGNVLIKDAKLSGKVSILSDVAGIVDLNAQSLRENFEFREERLFFENVKIIIKSDTKVEVIQQR